MTDYKGVIVIKHKGQNMPEDAILSILSQYQGRWGYALLEDGEFTIEHNADTPDPGDLKSFLDDSIDDEMFMYFSNHPKDSEDGNAQPFSVFSDGGTVRMIAFIDGHFPKYDRQDGNSPAMHVAIDYLIPKLSKIWKGAGGDMPSFIHECFEDATTVQELSFPIGDQGAMILVSQTGEYNKYLVDRSAVQHTWGWTSNTLDAAEPEHKEAEGPEVPATVVPTKQKKSFKAGGASTAGDAVVTRPKATGTPPGNAVPITAKADEKVSLPPPSPDSSEFEWIDVPQGKSHNSLKDWYRTTLKSQQLPQEWKVLKKVRVPKSNKGLKSKTELESTAAVVPAKGVVPDPKAKDKDKKHTTTDSAALESGSVIREKVPLITADSKAKIVDDFLKRAGIVKQIDGHIQEIKDPEKLLAIETRFPTFWQATGLQLSDTENWPHTVLVSLNKEFPEAGAVLLANYRTALRRANAQLNKAAPIEPADTKKETTAEVVPLRQKKSFKK